MRRQEQDDVGAGSKLRTVKNMHRKKKKKRITRSSTRPCLGPLSRLFCHQSPELSVSQFNLFQHQAHAPEGASSMRALINFFARRSCFSHHMMLACSSASPRLTRHTSVAVHTDFENALLVQASSQKPRLKLQPWNGYHSNLRIGFTEKTPMHATSLVEGCWLPGLSKAFYSRPWSILHATQNTHGIESLCIEGL